MNQGVVLRGPDGQIEAQAKRKGLGVEIASAEYRLAMTWDEVLVVEPGTKVPWDMVATGLGFLEAWDAAVPMYGALAKDLGTSEERKRTEALTLDLRVPVYACELLFVRGDGAGAELVAAWDAEIASGPSTAPRNDSRLAFLRAVARVKPRLCVLPSSWLGLAEQRAARDARSHAAMPVARPAPVRVEVAPGRWVLCQEGQEEQVRERFRLVGRRK
jgi:hypothetical protein